MLGTDGGSRASRSTIYWEKAFTCVLSWAYQNLASSQFGQDKATVDVLGMCFIRIPLYLVYSPYFNKGVCCNNGLYISQSLLEKIRHDYELLYKEYKENIKLLKEKGFKIKYDKPERITQSANASNQPS